MGIGKVGLILNSITGFFVSFWVISFSIGMTYGENPLAFLTILLLIFPLISMYSIKKCQKEEFIFRTLFFSNLLIIFLETISLIQTSNIFYFGIDTFPIGFLVFLINSILIVVGFFRYRKP